MVDKKSVVEIGESYEIALGEKIYVFHRRGDPIEEAEAIKELIEEHGLTQKEIASMMRITQAHVSRVLSLLSLEPEFQDRIREGTLPPTVAFELVKLPANERMSFLDEVMIRVKDVMERRRVRKAL